MSKVETGQAVINYLTNLILKKIIQKQTGITKQILPGDKINAEAKAKFAIESLKNRGNIDINNLTKSDLEFVAQGIVNPLKNVETKVVKKSADILPFTFKRSFADELAAASKKGDFKRMTGIMKLDPKFKEAMKSYNKMKEIEAASLKDKKIIPIDRVQYETPDIGKMTSEQKMDYVITKPEETKEFLKRGKTLDDIIYAQDQYGMTAPEMLDAIKSGKKFPFADGGVAGLLGERTGFRGGYLASGAKELGKKYKGSTLSAILENPKILGAELGHDGIMELMKLLPSLFADGGPARQNFKMGRRAFLKMLAGTGAGIAGLKSGLIGLLGGKKAATEVVKDVATSGSTPPPYFFKLVDKIQTLGDDVTKKYATKEREKVTKYKDYELTEDLTTGEQTIQKFDSDDLDYGPQKFKETYMNYKPGRGQADEATGKVESEYLEDTTYVRADGGNKGEIYKTVDGVPDEVIEEGSAHPLVKSFGMTKKADGGRIGLSKGGGLVKLLQSFMDRRKFLKTMVGNTEKNRKARELEMLKKAMEEARENPGFEFPSGPELKTEIEKKIGPILLKDRKLNADGGRINFSKGGFLKFLSGLNVNSTTARFLEKVFGKKAMAEMPKRDPELFKGLLETTEMYRKRDKEGLKKYMKGFLPHMDDAEIEKFIIGNPEIGDMSGVLLRLGSGRDYAGKIDMIKRAQNMRKLDDLEVTENMIRKPNASGGIAKMLGE